MIGMTGDMGEVSMNVTGLLPKISSLFNSRKFSDVEFVFIYKTGTTETMYGHKLILALRSEVFAYRFFDKKETSFKVTLPASKKPPFSHLLRFLYTDEMQLHTFEEAQELYDLANEYAVEELIEKCANYMQGSLTIENIFPKYECALMKNMWRLLKDCQDFVCSNTQLVLESVDFRNASADVVEDIVKQNNLSVSSESDVIVAVLKWGSEEMKRRKIDDEKYLRPCIDPFMKHIRFLTLSFEEYDNFIQKFDVLSGYESSILTRKIFQPQCNVDFPECLCSITIKRGIIYETESMLPVTHAKNMSLDLFPKSTSHDSPSERPLLKKPVSFPNNTFPNSPTMTALPVSFPNSTSPDSSSKTSPVLYNSKSTTHISNFKPKTSNVPESPTTHANGISFQVKKFSPFNETNMPSSQIKQMKYLSSPNIADQAFFSPNMHDSRLREYEFPLVEGQPCLGTSFLRDVKSTILFEMKTGNIRLDGFQLKIKNNARAFEELDIDVDLKGFSKQPFSQLYKKELKNNVLTVRFSEKMVLQNGCKGELEVSIDNLLLNRCSICNFNSNKINNGLNFACEISLSSTVNTDNGFPFLISKLTYIPC